jgi:hypothetical protein
VTASRYTNNGAIIVADKAGITYGVAVSVGTVSIPAGVEPFHVRINGDSTQVDGSNQFKVRITFAGGEWNNTNADALFPKVMIWDRTTADFGGPSGVMPYNLRVGGQVGTSVECIALAGGSMDILFKGMTFTKWTVVLDF